MTQEPGGKVGDGGPGGAKGRGRGARARQADPGARSVRVLPTPPPLPVDEVQQPSAGWLAPVARPRPVAPAILEEVGYALRPYVGEGPQSARLADEIDALQQRTLETVSDNGPLSDQCQELLSQARASLQASPGDTVEVEDLLAKLRTLLSRADRSVVGARRYGPRLAAYGAAWLLVLLLVLVFDRELAAWIGKAAGRTELTSLAGLAPFWMCMVWGGIGAVAASLYGLYRHVVRRDFDSEHTIGYLVQPALGVVVGALVYMLTAALFFVLGEGHTLAAAQITATNPLALISALAGFGQRHAYELLDGAVQAPDGGVRAGEAGGRSSRISDTAGNRV